MKWRAQRWRIGSSQNDEVYFPEAINQQRSKYFLNVSLKIENPIAFISAVLPSHISNLGRDIFLYKVFSENLAATCFFGVRVPLRFFFSFRLNKNKPRNFLKINSWINSKDFYIKFVSITLSESILIVSWIITNFEKLACFEQFVLACCNIFASFLLWMLCSEPVLSFACVWRLLRHSIVFSCVTKPYGFELLTLPSVGLYFFDWRWIKNNPKRLKIKHVSFLKAFLVLMKLNYKRL